MTGPSYIEPSIRARVAVGVLIVITVAVVHFIDFYIEQSMPDKTATSPQVHEAATKFNDVFVIVIGFNVAIAVLLSRYFGQIGVRALRTGEFPPRGTTVLRRTKIRQGRIARVSAWFALSFALAVWAPIGILVYIYGLVANGT